MTERATISDNIVFANPQDLLTQNQQTIDFKNPTLNESPDCHKTPEPFIPVEQVYASETRLVITPAMMEIAQEICAECVVFDACNEQGKSESAGVWAGVNRGTEKKHVKIAQARRIRQMRAAKKK